MVRPRWAARPREGVHLPAVQQQLARAHRLVVVDVPLRVGGDVHAVKPELAVQGVGVGAPKVDLARADGLDLGAPEDQARLVGLKNFVVEGGAAAWWRWCGRSPSAAGSRCPWRAVSLT